MERSIFGPCKKVFFDHVEFDINAMNSPIFIFSSYFSKENDKVATLETQGKFILSTTFSVDGKLASSG